MALNPYDLFDVRSLLSEDERAVQDAFALAPDAKARLVGRHIILIDDVHASGATLRACARLLARAKAARVSALTFARVVPETPDDSAFDFASLDSDMGPMTRK